MRLAILFATIGFLAAAGTPARAFHSGDLAVASTVAHGGNLTLAFDFDTVVRTNFDPDLTALLPPGESAYSNDEPGFDALDADVPAESLFVVDDGTEITVEITAIDEGKVQLFLNATTLAHVGDSVVVGAQGTDGHLYPPEYDATAYDTASVKCQQAVNKYARKFAGKLGAALEKCLRKVAILDATAAAGLSTTKAQLAADKACGDAGGTVLLATTMLGKIAAARQAAFDAIKLACGAAGSDDYDDNAISQHLGLVACNIEDIVSGGHHGAHEALEAITQGGQPVIDSLPCLFPTTEAD
jgi:hypothetical protein